MLRRTRRRPPGFAAAPADARRIRHPSGTDPGNEASVIATGLYPFRVGHSSDLQSEPIIQAIVDLEELRRVALALEQIPRRAPPVGPRAPGI